MPKVLIADDDTLLQELLRFKLEGADHEVIIASNGDEAVAKVMSELPDVIVLDSMMPIKTGPEVLREIKAAEATRNIPVIMLTARKGQVDIVEALRSGAADYITKPFLPDELAVRIETVLHRS